MEPRENNTNGNFIIHPHLYTLYYSVAKRVGGLISIVFYTLIEMKLSERLSPFIVGYLCSSAHSWRRILRVGSQL
ncbi:hypothetical protein RSAG8_04276, partial [Rhizoctonia solani AG-8 WAC10335]